MQSEVLANFFLSKSQQQKLKILKYLESGRVTLALLEEELGLSTRQIKEFTLGLMEDIQADSMEKQPLLVWNREEIQFVPKLSSSEYVELMADFRNRYLTNASLFQALLFVLEKRTFSIMIMASELAYSESYTYKLFSKLKELFQFIDLGIQFTKKDETMIQLVGNESTIRILHYLSIAVASKGSHWLFKTMSEKEIMSTQAYLGLNRYDKLSPIGKSRVNYIVAVYELALKNGFKLSQLDDEVIQLGEVMDKEINLNLYLKHVQINNKIDRSSHDEFIHLTFLADYFTQELRSDVEKEKLGRHLFSMNTNPIVKNCKQLLALVTEDYQLESTSYYLLLYSLCNRFVVIHYFNLYKFMPLVKVPPIRGKIKCFVESCIEQSFSDYRKAPSFEKINYSFTQIITSYLIVMLPVAQKVYVEFFHRPEYKLIIENAIRHNYTSNVLKITENYDEADIVISDTHGYSNSQYFYFKDVFDQDSWEELGLYLNRMISKEIIARS